MIMTTIELEQYLSFDHFDNAMALQAGMDIVNEVKEKQLGAVRVRVVLGEDTVFQHIMDGKKGDHWLNMKQTTVEKFDHSSYYVFELAQDDPEKYEGYKSEMAICGGGFPLMVKHERVGSIMVSGLAHQDDHQLIVNALTKLKERNDK